MTERPNLEDLELTDAELVQVLKNHGIDRRTVMRALGVGGVLALGAGTASAKHDQPHPPHIDSHYGYAGPADEKLPRKLRPDHEVGLHVHPAAITDGDDTTMPFHFSPTGLQISPGDIVRFNLDTPEHTITAYHGGQGRQQRVPDDSTPYSSPVMNAGGFWLYRFDEPGTHDLFCAPHEQFGMVMRLVVGDPDDADYDGSFGPAGPPPGPRPPISKGELNAIGVPTWPFPTAHDVFATGALTVSNIVSSGSVSVGDVEDDL